MPAVEDGASRGAIGQSTQTGALFTTTHWSMVLAAQGQSPEADAALEKLCRTYWRPLYGFVRRQGAGPEEAQDLTQGFLHTCWNEGIWTRSVERRGGSDLICLNHSLRPCTAIIHLHSFILKA